MRIAYFAPEVTEPAVIRRCTSLCEAGAALQLFAFRRTRFAIAFQGAWEVTELGTTTNARYVQRVWKLLRATVVILKERKRLRDADVILARNLDMAILSLAHRWLARSNAQFVYEVLDIPTLMAARGIWSRVLRRIERTILSRTDLLVLSSPGFRKEYFEAWQGYSGPWHLLENMLAYGNDTAYPRPRAADRTLEGGRSQNNAWTVGWFGTLKDPWSLDAMEAVAARINGRVRFLICGFSSSPGMIDLERLTSGSPFLDYAGPYDATRELADLYRKVDFMWCLDIHADARNNEWCLPNRLYEAAYFGVPLLAVRNTETGRRVEDLRLGWVVDDFQWAGLANLLLDLTPAEYGEIVKHILSLDSRLFSGQAQTEQLVKRLQGSQLGRLRL